MAKFLRKVFLIANLPNTTLIVKKNPVFLLEFLNFFSQPIVYKFVNPVDGQEFEEKVSLKPITNFSFFIFYKNQSFVKNKTKAAGRIKRKIRRKVIFQNRVID
jgi:hypothetical protein